MKPLVSVVIPVYNEERVINNCLTSLANQTYHPLEIIVIDDGSTDTSVSEIPNSNPPGGGPNLVLLKQNHLGPGAARNLGATKAKGEILVFVDADMEFDPGFIGKLTLPIREGKTKGTFSKEEFLLNTDNVWARCWNLNLGRRPDRMHSDNYPEKQEVFRAILKTEFVKAGGFDGKIGYTDDWSVSKKLGILATNAPQAKFYHRNTETLVEVWQQARWFGKNEFLTRNLIRKFYNLVRYFPLFGLIKGLAGAVKYHQPEFLPFKIIYDSAVFSSVFLSLFNEPKYK